MPATGTRLRSQVCDTQIIVVRPPAKPVALTCGGAPMIEIGAPVADGLALDPELSAGSLLGKRYTLPEEDGTLEVLVTKPGKGTLADGTTPLVLKSAKPLPASD
ncbi:MAG: hypothetical protein ACQSGP_18500 [Frankia sp.]